MSLSPKRKKIKLNNDVVDNNGEVNNEIKINMFEEIIHILTKQLNLPFEIVDVIYDYYKEIFVIYSIKDKYLYKSLCFDNKVGQLKLAMATPITINSYTTRRNGNWIIMHNWYDGTVTMYHTILDLRRDFTLKPKIERVFLDETTDKLYYWCDNGTFFEKEDYRTKPGLNIFNKINDSMYLGHGIIFTGHDLDGEIRGAYFNFKNETLTYLNVDLNNAYRILKLDEEWILIINKSGQMLKYRLDINQSIRFKTMAHFEFGTQFKYHENVLYSINTLQEKKIQSLKAPFDKNKWITLELPSMIEAHHHYYFNI